MQKLLSALALGLSLAAFGCGDGGDAAATTKPASAGAAMASQDGPPQPNIARPEIARPEIARPEIARPEIARPSERDEALQRDPVTGVPVYPSDAGVPKAPPDGEPLNR